jgi:hypothetical protein
MKKKQQEVERPLKFERHYEDEFGKSVWKYDLKKNPNGPISVETNYKPSLIKEWQLYQRRGR